MSTKLIRLYDFDGRRGCVIRTKCRATGAMIAVYHMEQAGFGEAGDHPWVLVCEDHQSATRSKGVNVARNMMTESDLWCPGCDKALADKRDALRVTGPK